MRSRTSWLGCEICLRPWRRHCAAPPHRRKPARPPRRRSLAVRPIALKSPKQESSRPRWAPHVSDDWRDTAMSKEVQFTMKLEPELRDQFMAEAEAAHRPASQVVRSEEHTSELQSLMRISYAVFCLKKKKHRNTNTHSY